MPCSESERPQSSADFVQTPYDPGTSRLPPQRVNTDSTHNEHSARSCRESTSTPGINTNFPSSAPRSDRSSSTAECRALPRRTTSNARFSICPNNIQDFPYYRTLPRVSTSNGGRYSPFWKRSCEEKFRQSWYPTGTDWHDSASNSSTSSANLTGANSWYTMKWKLHPERGTFRTCSTSCTSTTVECRGLESTSLKRKRLVKEKTEEEKERIKKARMEKALEKREERQKALDKMKKELGDREGLKIQVNDPEELRKLARKDELRKIREVRKREIETKKKDEKQDGNRVTPPREVAKPKRVKEETITKSFSVRLKPNRDQRQILNHWIGCARFTYNQGLKIIKEYTSKEEKPSINESLFRTVKGQLVPYDKVDRDKPWLHNCPEKIRAYAVHKELYRTYKSNFSRGVLKFDPRYRTRDGLQSIHMPKEKVIYYKETRKFRIFPNHKMKTEHFNNLSEISRASGTIDAGSFNLFGSLFNRTSNRSNSSDRKRSKKKMRLVEKCFQSTGKSLNDVTFVRTATNKYELRLTYDECVEEVQSRNFARNPEKKFDSVFIDPGNRTFSTMYTPEGFTGSVGDKDISRIFRLLKTHDRLQSEHDKKNNKNNTREGSPNSLNGRSRINLAVLREKIKNLRDEVHWQTISFLLKNFKNIFIPRLNTKSMVLKGSRKLNTKSARQMLTWSHGIFMDRLLEKSREFRDTHVHVVDECYTSKTCGSCGIINESLGSSKWFSCKSCSFQCERDLNGARNIFIKTVCEDVLRIS